MSILRIKPLKKPTIRLSRENLEQALDIASSNNENKLPAPSTIKIKTKGPSKEIRRDAKPEESTVSARDQQKTPARHAKAVKPFSPAGSPEIEFDKSDPKWFLKTDWSTRERPKFRHPSLMSFMVAAETGNQEVVREFLAKGMDPNKLVRYRLLNTIIRMAAVHCASFAGQIEIMRDLVAAGGDPELRDDWYGGTPLHWAVYAENYDMTKFLLDEYKCDKTVKNTEDQVAFDLLSDETQEWRDLLLSPSDAVARRRASPQRELPVSAVELEAGPDLPKSKRPKLDTPDSTDSVPETPSEAASLPSLPQIKAAAKVPARSDSAVSGLPAVPSPAAPSQIAPSQTAPASTRPFAFPMVPFSLPFPVYGSNSAPVAPGIFSGPAIKRENSSATTPIISKLFVESYEDDIEMPRRVPVGVSSDTGSLITWNASASGANIVLDMSMTELMRNLLQEANDEASYFVEMKRNGRLELSTGERLLSRQWDRTVSPTAAIAAYAVAQNAGKKSARDQLTVSNLVTIIDTSSNNFQSPDNAESQMPWTSLGSKKIKISLVHGYNLLEFLILIRLADSEKHFIDRISAVIYNC